MKKSRLEKGITLIALIITIVLLLIIAVVTIGSIQKSKIIDHAQNASSKYTLEQEKEQIELALGEWQIQKILGGKSFKEVVEDSLEGVATVEENVDGSLTIKMDKTGNQYILTNAGEILPATKGILISPTSTVINEGEKEKLTVTLLGGLSGNITYESSDTSVATVDSKGEVTGVALGTATITVTCGEYSATCKVGVSNIEQYLFGDSEGKLTGRPATDIINISNGQFLNNTAPLLQGDAVITPKGLTQIGNWGIAYIEYQGIYYKFRANMTASEVEGVPASYTDVNYGLVAIANAETRLGKTVKYDDKLWTIIYDDNTNGLQMISNETFSLDSDDKYALGDRDSLINNNWSNLDEKTAEFISSDLNENKSIDTELEKSLYSYNKAIDHLNSLCDSIVADASFIDEVRCVGTNPTDKGDENKAKYTSTNLANWPTTSAGIINGKANGTDENYIYDYDRIMTVYGNAYIENSAYWLGSRFVYEGENEHGYVGVNFSVRSIGESGLISGTILCAIESEIRTPSPSRNLRPVVVLNSDANLVTDTTGSAHYILQ